MRKQFYKPDNSETARNLNSYHDSSYVSVSRPRQDEEDDEYDDDDGHDEEDDAGADCDHRSLPVGRKSVHRQQDCSGSHAGHNSEEAPGQQAGRTPPRDAWWRTRRWMGQEVLEHGQRPGPRHRLQSIRQDGIKDLS